MIVELVTEYSPDTAPSKVISARTPRFAEFLNPVTCVVDLWSHRDLLRELVSADLAGRYSGSILGLVWAIINPLLLLSVYTFVFGGVLRARWPGVQSDDPTRFALTLFCGLIVFTVFSECLSRSAVVIRSVPNYITKVVFPIEILPVSLVCTALFHGALALLVLLCTTAFISGSLYLTLIALPFILVPLVFLSLGVTWLVAGLGVFFRDIGHGMGFVIQVLFFLTPIFYPIDAVPEPWRLGLRLNPLASVVANVRDVVLTGIFPDWVELLAWVLATATLALLAYAWFMRTKHAFADAL